MESHPKEQLLTKVASNVLVTLMNDSLIFSLFKLELKTGLTFIVSAVCFAALTKNKQKKKFPLGLYRLRKLHFHFCLNISRHFIYLRFSDLRKQPVSVTLRASVYPIPISNPNKGRKIHTLKFITVENLSPL